MYASSARLALIFGLLGLFAVLQMSFNESCFCGSVGYAETRFMNTSTPPKKSVFSRLWWVALGLWLVLTIVASIALWNLHGNIVGAQTRELNLLSLALTDEIDRGLQGAEEGLRAIRLELREARLAATGPVTARTLRTHADLMPLVSSLWLLDLNGEVLSASDATPIPALTSFSPALDPLAEDAVAISRPYTDVGALEPMIALAVRSASSPGVSQGWILAAMPATKLLGAFSIAAPSADARMVVYRDDGARLVGSSVVTSTLDEAALALRLSHRQAMEMRRFSDGSEHLVTVHDVPRFGLKVIVSRDLDAVLGEFSWVVLLTAVGLVLFLLIMVVSIQLVLRAERRSVMAQQALQAQLSRASKLQSLGTLAGGVAHDFNNVLAAIVGFGEMAQDAAPTGSHQARQLDRVLQAAQRGKALIERILAFSRGGAHASLVFELQPVVAEVLDLLAATLRANVVLERQLDAPDARLRGDPTQAFEAVMNLCTNALQAMPSGGMLSVRLEHQTVLAPRVLSHSQLAAGRCVVLTVSDQGQGITSDVMEHLFEPFFTTRSAESGTGLGLAVVHGVVAEFGGAIDVRSQVGKGSTFTLYFPECTDPVAPVATPGPPAPAGRGQTVLVVDDEPTLVALMEEMLTGLGYQSVGYTDPIDALQALLDNPQQFAAVITDEVMPGLTGTQLTQNLIQAFGPQGPHLPVLLVSGYGGALLAQRAVAAGVSKVLTKPLRRADLANALAALLH